jgi:hypothetical protein
VNSAIKFDRQAMLEAVEIEDAFNEQPSKWDNEAGLGVFVQDFLQFRVQCPPEMFGITRSSRHYHRLGKLFMLLLTSGGMKKRLCDILKPWLHEPRAIQTTSITVHEEGRTDRGALKVFSREKLDDGRSRIIYRGNFRDDSFADVVSDWLKKHGERKRA